MDFCVMWSEQQKNVFQWNEAFEKHGMVHAFNGIEKC